jgi:proteic killer suppression protein
LGTLKRPLIRVVREAHLDILGLGAYQSETQYRDPSSLHGEEKSGNNYSLFGFLDVRRTTYYDRIVIRSFRSKDAELIFQGRYSKRFNRLASIIERKLVQIHAAIALSDISIFPGNRLEALKGSRAGQHSIRINDQYRICFVWRDGDAFEVEIVDYH